MSRRIPERHSHGHIPLTSRTFVFSLPSQIPLWKQKAGDESSDYLVVWDYHVVLIYKSCDEEYWVYDQDSVLSFPCPFPQYWRLGIRADAGLRPDFHRHFRLIPAAVFLTTFASDRSHMRSPVDGSWLRPPPDYPCIRTPETSNNLDSFISMRSEVGVGTIFQSSEALREYFSRSVA